MINIAHLGDTNPEIKLSDTEVFDEYEKYRQRVVVPQLLSIHLCSKFLAPNGYVALATNIENFRNQGINIVDGTKIPT